MMEYIDPDGNEITLHQMTALLQKRKEDTSDDSWWRRRTTVGSVTISTVWLPINHAFGGGRPLYWETMIFGSDEYEDFQWRYSSREEALREHARIVEAVRQGRLV